MEAERLGGVVLQVVAGPARAGDGVVVAGAGVDADREAVALGGGIDRPVDRLAERLLAEHQHQDLHEARIAGAALDLLHRALGRLHRQHHRAPEPGVLGEPFRRQPVVEGAREGRGQVLVAERLHREQAVADGMGEAEAVERRLRGLDGIGIGAALAPVGAHGERRIGRIGDGLPRVDAAHLGDMAPALVHIAPERARRRHARVEVAVDGAGPVVAQVAFLPCSACVWSREPSR